jgi:hypothetical protein
MSATLQDILASRKALFDPQRELINQQIAQLDPQQQAAEQGLNAQLDQKYNDITNNAVASGMAYSGKPIAEKQRELATFYAPAAANLKATYAGNKSKLQAALLGINQDEVTSAQQLQTEQQKAEADAAYKQQQLAIQRQKATKTAKPTAYDQQQQFNSILSQAFQGYNPKNKAQNFYTEKAVIPYLVAQTGLPADQVASQVYAFRQAQFGE